MSWRPSFYNVRLVNITSKEITCKVEYIPQKTIFLVTCVYRFNTREERKALWSSLQETHRVNRKPCLLIGHCNSILYPKDRIRGSPVSLEEVVDFSKCMKECGLIGLPHQGNQYIWTDKGNEERMYSKINWAFINDV